MSPIDIQYSEGHNGRGSGRRRAWVKKSPPGEPLRWMCRRERPNGSLARVTCFFFKRSAEKAAAAYVRDGTIKGWDF